MAAQDASQSEHHRDHHATEVHPGLWRHGHPHNHPAGSVHHALLKDGPAHEHWHSTGYNLPDHHPDDLDVHVAPI